MHNPDDLLQQKLAALENGAHLDQVLASLNGNADELAPLLRLAVAVRRLPHPFPASAAAARLRAAAVVRNPASGRQNARQPSGGSRLATYFRLFFFGLRPAYALAGAAVLLVMSALVAWGVWLAGPSGAQAATLLDVDGKVEVASAPASGDWQAVTGGAQVKTGARLRTGPGSTATLLFFDGSRTTLAANSDLILTRVDGDWGKVVRVILTQVAGKSNNSVVPFQGKKSLFMVFTPTGAASVHGTQFNVMVDSTSRSRFSVNSGKVLVSNDRSEVFVSPGQVAAVEPGQTLEDPSYEFSLQGQLTSQEGSTWIVSGTPFTVISTTVVSGAPQVSDYVNVEGRVLASGEWIADKVSLAEDEATSSTFTGAIEGMGGRNWVISGWSVVVDNRTTLGPGLAVGVTARVSVSLLPNGRWLAESIEALQAPSDETPPPSPDPSGVTADLSFEPEEVEAETCTTDVHLAGALSNGSTEGEAAEVTLGSQVVAGAQYVNEVDVAPASFATIAAGGQVSFDVHLALEGEAWNAAPAGTEVKVRVFITSQTGGEDEEHSRMTVTVTRCGEATPGPSDTPEPVTATITATLPVTDTLTPVPTITATLPVTATMVPTMTVNCTGAQPHPTGTTLADRYGVNYEEIMGWFCQGFGFGEIDLAYSLSQQYGLPVAQLFALKASGVGWGQIKKIAAQAVQEVTPQPPEQAGPGNGNGNGGGNGNGNGNGNGGNPHWATPVPPGDAPPAVLNPTPVPPGHKKK